MRSLKNCSRIVGCTYLGLILVVFIGGLGAAQGAVTIDVVVIGNAGNSADSETGYGAVDYTYSMGKFEVTAGQYVAFLNAVAKTDTYGLYNPDMDIEERDCQITQNGTSGNYTYDFSGRPSGDESDWVNRPVNQISWGDAARFANWLHNGQPSGDQDLTTTEDGSYYLNGAMTNEELLGVTRKENATWVIPTENEWYKAAYHKNDGVTGNYFNYPTSSDSKPSNQLIDPDPGNNATYDARPGYTIGSPYYQTEVGSHENSDSPYGTFDQAGNVTEWTEGIVASDRITRGGSFHDDYADLHATSSYHWEPTYEGGPGFRVAYIPEPATLALLALGGLAMIRRRYRPIKKLAGLCENSIGAGGRQNRVFSN